MYSTDLEGTQWQSYGEILNLQESENIICGARWEGRLLSGQIFEGAFLSRENTFLFCRCRILQIIAIFAWYYLLRRELWKQLL